MCSPEQHFDWVRVLTRQRDRRFEQMVLLVDLLVPAWAVQEVVPSVEEHLEIVELVQLVE